MFLKWCLGDFPNMYTHVCLFPPSALGQVCQDAVREVQAANTIIDSHERRWGPNLF